MDLEKGSVRVRTESDRWKDIKKVVIGSSSLLTRQSYIEVAVFLGLVQGVENRGHAISVLIVGGCLRTLKMINMEPESLKFQGSAVDRLDSAASVYKLVHHPQYIRLGNTLISDPHSSYRAESMIDC